MPECDIRTDLKAMCARQGIARPETARQAGTSPAYLSRMIHDRHTIVDPTFVKCTEAPG